MTKRKIHFSPISEALMGEEKGEDLHFRQAEQQDEIVGVAGAALASGPCYYAFSYSFEPSSQWEGFHRPSCVGTTLKSIRLMTPSVPLSYATSI
jgi:hypothetical protein